MFCDYCATERLQRHVSSVDSDQAIRYFREPAEGRRAIGEIFLQCARGHLFETEREHAIGSAGGNGLPCQEQRARDCRTIIVEVDDWDYRSEEHTSELQSLMRITYAVFCLNQKTQHNRAHHNNNSNESQRHP